MSATYEFTFKKLKRHLKITWAWSVDGGLTKTSRAGKLSFPQWEGIGGIRLVTNPQQFDEVVVEFVYGCGGQALGALINLEVVRSAIKQQETHPYSTRRLYLLSDFGKQLLAALPPCPPRDEWASKPPSAVRSPENVKLSRPQKRMLKDWPKQRSSAVPGGGTRAEESRWISATHYPRASIDCLLEMELIEPGVEGVALVDGALSFDSEEELGLVYRMTVLGALMANSD